jgi:hypothetical protein
MDKEQKKSSWLGWGVKPDVSPTPKPEKDKEPKDDKDAAQESLRKSFNYYR